MRNHKVVLAGVLAGAIIGLPNVRAQQQEVPPELIKQLQKRIEELEQKVHDLEGGRQPAVTNNSAQQVQELDQKVKVLERQRELDQEAAEAKLKEAPKITLGEKGFSFESANGNFGVQLKGVLQVDSRTFFNDAGISGNDGILLRRARPILQGTVFRDFDFQFVPDFGGTSGAQIFDAWLNYKYNPALQLEAGKFKTPVGLEQLVSDRDLWFNERSLVTDLVPNRDLGFMLHGDLFGGVASYAAGVFNGVGDAKNSNNADFEDNKAFAGRLFFQPFLKTQVSAAQGFGFGVGGSYEDPQRGGTGALPATTGGTAPGYATVGQQQFFAYRANVAAAGEHWRLSPQGSYTYGPFGLIGEYIVGHQKVSRPGFESVRLENTGWQVAGSWLLTGEDATIGTVVPRHPFSPKEHGWGAWQLVARYSELNIDSDAFPVFSDPTVSANAAQEWSVGLNWYLNRNVKVATSFSHTTFDGAGRKTTSAPGIVTYKPENVLFTRIQLAF